MKALELSGHTSGRLTVIGQDGPHADRAIWWICKCDCGSTKSFRGADLKRNFIKSCGCWNREVVTRRNSTHGGSSSRLYRIWQAMKDRTENPRNYRYSYYGGRGISICREWHDFTVFRNWALTNGYANNLSIDRYPDNNGNYEPENCRWATQRQQIRNRRTKEQMKGHHNEAI